MVSSVLISTVCVFGWILIPAVWADYCSSFRDLDSSYHESQQCALYCCGDCNHRYCCMDKSKHWTQAKEERCPKSPLPPRPSISIGSRIAMIFGSVLGAIIPIIICMGLITCFVAPCCLIYKKCRKGRDRRDQNVTFTATVVHTPPQQPLSPSGYHPSYPSYQPVPVQLGYGGMPNPNAPPPSYREATDPAYSPVAFSSDQPMYLLPGTPCAQQPHSEQLLPYHPSYGP